VGLFLSGIEPHSKVRRGRGILIVASVVMAMTVAIVAPAVIAIVPAVGIIVAAAIVAVMSAVWVIMATPVRIIAVSVIGRAVVVCRLVDIFLRGNDLRGEIVEIECFRCLYLSEAADSKHYGGGAGDSSQDFHRLALAVIPV
jgi:hypothetical protein